MVMTDEQREQRERLLRMVQGRAMEKLAVIAASQGSRFTAYERQTLMVGVMAGATTLIEVMDQGLSVAAAVRSAHGEGDHGARGGLEGDSGRSGG